MMYRSKANSTDMHAPVTIRISSKALKFKNQIFSVTDTSISWVEMLKNHKVRIPKHCNFWIRNQSAKIVTIPDESIQHFLDQYKCLMRIYTVTITKANRATKGEIIERRLNRLQYTTGSKRHIASTSRPGKPHYPEVGQSAPKLTRYEPRPSRNKYAEDDCEYQEAPVRQEQIYQGDDSFDDDASMFSQGSQDDQDDGGLVKHEIIRKIREKMSNGDLVRVMNEYKEMKRRGKMMKVARHVPLIMNFFNVVLDQ